MESISETSKYSCFKSVIGGIHLLVTSQLGCHKNIWEVIFMNQATMKGKWNQMKGDAKKKWGNLTDDDLQQVEGDHDKLVGKIQERYGKSKEEAEREVNDWNKIY